MCIATLDQLVCFIEDCIKILAARATNINACKCISCRHRCSPYRL